MRVFHRVEVAEPLPDAIVAQPGPLLNDVRGQAEGARAQVAEEVRAAWKEEAGEVASADDLDFASGRTPSVSAPASSESTSEPTARPEAEVRHRFHRDRDDDERHPRRLIIERDQRRGRPPKKAGSDPPS